MRRPTGKVYADYQSSPGCMSAASIAAEVEGVGGQPVSTQTIHRTLHQIGLHGCRSRRKPLLKMMHKKVVFPRSVSTQSCLSALQAIPLTLVFSLTSFSAIKLYINLCVPFQIMSNQLNLLQVNSSQGIEHLKNETGSLKSETGMLLI